MEKKMVDEINKKEEMKKSMFVPHPTPHASNTATDEAEEEAEEPEEITDAEKTTE